MTSFAPNKLGIKSIVGMIRERARQYKDVMREEGLRKGKSNKRCNGKNIKKRTKKEEQNKTRRRRRKKKKEKRARRSTVDGTIKDKKEMRS